MKPITLTARNRRSFPLVELNYQPMRLTGFQAHCGKTVAPAFHSISNNYFQREARRDFVGEACFFVAIIVTIAVPLFSMASALRELCGAIGQF